MTPKSRTARVRVPASTSNLGAGFDCVGVAVDRWLTASVKVDEKSAKTTIARDGSVAKLSHKAEEDLVHVGFRLACEASRTSMPRGLAYDISSTIPVARGLGASAAALVAGAFLANGALNLELTAQDIASLCAHYEGHPDNVAPSTLGGAVLGIPVNNGQTYAFSELRVNSNLALVFTVPELEILTSEARRVLPTSVPHTVAVRAAAKSAALVEGLRNGDAALLSFALDDVVHVPYRRQLIPGYDAIVAAAVNAGAFGATLSGSGSTMLAIAPRKLASGVGEAMQSAWRTQGETAEVIISDKPVAGAKLE